MGRATDSVFVDLSFDVKELEPGAQEAIETLGQLGDSAGVALARRLLGLCRWRGGNATEGLAELERALAAADTSGDQFALRRVVTTMGGILSDGPVTVGEATRRCEHLLEMYGSDLVMEAVITRFLSLFLAMAGRFDEARECVERSSVVLDELEHVTSWVYRRVAAETKRLLGDDRGAEHELIERWRSLRHLKKDGVDGRAINAACTLSLLYAAEGRWEEAAEHLAYSRDVPDPAFFRPDSVLLLAARARLAAHRGESADALELAGRAVELADGTDLLDLRALLWVELAQVCRVERASGASRHRRGGSASALRGKGESRRRSAAAGEARHGRIAGASTSRVQGQLTRRGVATRADAAIAHLCRLVGRVWT